MSATSAALDADAPEVARVAFIGGAVETAARGLEVVGEVVLGKVAVAQLQFACVRPSCLERLASTCSCTRVDHLLTVTCFLVLTVHAPAHRVVTLSQNHRCVTSGIRLVLAILFRDVSSVVIKDFVDSTLSDDLRVETLHVSGLDEVALLPVDSVVALRWEKKRGLFFAFQPDKIMFFQFIAA